MADINTQSVDEPVEGKSDKKKKPKSKKPHYDPAWDELVTVQLFKDGKYYKDDVFVSVNGENCVIKRGVPVQIKRKFALALEQSQMQDVKANEYAQQQQQEYQAQSKALNI